MLVCWGENLAKVFMNTSRIGGGVMPTEIGKQAVTDKIRNYILDNIGVDAISDDENFFENGLVNSLFVLQIMAFIEREFQLEINAADLKLENFSSLASLFLFVNSKQ